MSDFQTVQTEQALKGVDSEVLTFADTFSAIRERWVLLLLGPLVVGALAVGASYLMQPVFTATTLFMPPQQNQSAAASAVASLGALSSLIGGSGGVRTPADQYVALMQSNTVSDRIIDHFKLLGVYDTPLRVDARLKLSRKVRISIGKKDGLISVDVDDVNPQRAADIANRYVEELQRVTAGLAVTEAQQRRVFFERQLQQTRDQLTTAQQAMQASGFNQGALNAEPRAAADGYARLLAQATAAEVRLQVMRGSLADAAPEVRQQQATLAALRAQLGRIESTAQQPSSGPGYIGTYREFKYRETLFELFARQYELARVDESREGPLVQVVDPALPPERRSAPRRTLIALGSVASSAFLLLLYVLVRQAMRGSERARRTAV